MSADFDVRAQLTLDSRAAASGLARFASGMDSLGRQLAGHQSMATQMVGRLAGIAFAYVGLNAGIATFKSLTSQAVNYTSELEATRIGLQAVLQAVRGGSWEEAGMEAEGVFTRLKKAAMVSPATTGEMFSIYQGIVGPVAAAGYELEKVHQLTVDTTLAASSLHVDYAQASRDVSAMVRGAAGLDVKLFSALRSTNAIKENAEQWNKMSQSDRIEKLAVALAKYRKSGEAFGKSWKGVTATFEDVRNEAMRAFATPVLDKLAVRLDRLNTYFTQNETRIVALIAKWGDGLGVAIARAWDRGEDAAKYVISHWDQISYRISSTVDKLQEMSPMLLKAAKAYAAISIGGSVAGNVLMAGASVASLANTGVAGAGMLGGAMGAGTLTSVGAGGAVAGGAAMGLFGAPVSAGVTGAAVAGEAAAGTLGGAAATIAALPAVAVGLVAVGAAAPVVIDNWDLMASAMKGISFDLWDEMVNLATVAWKVIEPLAQTIGHVVAGGILTMGMALVAALRGLGAGASWALEQVRPFSQWLTNEIVPEIRNTYQHLDIFAWKFTLFMDKVKDALGISEELLKLNDKDNKWEPAENALMMISNGATAVREIERTKKKPAQQMNVTNDFRGSRITIDQKFDGDQDPDRVVMAMMGDLTKQAELRLSSGYASAFSR